MLNIKKLFNDVAGDEALRKELVCFLVKYEKKFQVANGCNIREEITGPIVDTLYSKSKKIFVSELQDGIRFAYRYMSKIMRDFILRHEKCPDHFWEPQTTKLLKMLSSGVKTAFVGGAYIGDQVVYIAKELQKSAGQCHAFEPNSQSFDLLKENCKLNGLDNVILNNKGLWYENKRLIFVGDDSHAYSKEIDASEDSGFDAVSINEYCLRNGIQKIDLVMLDLEGGEFNVLKGTDVFLKMPKEQAPVVIFEVHNSYVDWDNGLEKTDIGAYLTNMGYFLYAIRDFQSNYAMRDRKIELIPAATAVLDGPKHGFNMIAVKDKNILRNDSIAFCNHVSPKLLLHRNKSLHFPIS